MRKILYLLLSTFFVNSYALLAQSTQKNPATFSYGGFQIDETAVMRAPNLSEAREHLRHEIDIVNNIGLSSEILTFFKTIPINMVAADSYLGLYTPVNFAEGGFIDISIFDLDSNYCYSSTTLLHELLHGFHDQCLPNGCNNEAILNYYTDATHRHCYNWSLDNEKYDCYNYYIHDVAEYFAVTATTYLFGQDVRFEPHLRREIQKKQPEYYSYLKQLFGPTAGSYNDLSWSESMNRYGLELEDSF